MIAILCSYQHVGLMVYFLCVHLVTIAYSLSSWLRRVLSHGITSKLVMYVGPPVRQEIALS